MKKREFIFNLFFPRRCVYCNNVIGFLESCDRCEHNGQRLPLNFLRQDNSSLSSVDGVAGLYLYKDCIKECISRIKFGNDEESGSEISRQFAREYPSVLFPKIDHIICVPDFKEKNYSLAVNMYNELLKKTGKPKVEIVIKNRKTKKQHELNFHDRHKNLVGAFSCADSKSVEGKTFLIVDDVMTTGNTVNEIAKILRMNGAESVYSYVFASTSE